ncbi:MAG: M6 family metalloprotease domain-containing protein [Bacteroidales bacterium]|nr:M6 family metalloprotease domain-containing protein [Bacteroidales bacterium]
MKRNFIHTIIWSLISLLCLVKTANAVPADPRPIRVTQPDGTTLEIRIHGDEYLGWKTCNNRLVSQGPDGFYYYAQFEADGNITRTSTRVTAHNVSLQSFGATEVVPPTAAIQRAMERHQDVRAAQKMLPPLNNPFTHGEFRFLCILVNFADIKFTIDDPNTKFANLLNEIGYAENGGTGSAFDYYHENSNGVFSPSFDVYGPVNLVRNSSYYGGNGNTGSDQNPWALPKDAIEAAIAQCGLDLTQYDNNGDHVLDNVFFFYAGYNEAEGGPEDTIWPHKSTGYGSFQGIDINTYACSSELRGNSGKNMAGIGTFTHEFGHVLGLPDFYDTDYATNGYGRGLSTYSLMSTGCYNNNLNSPPYLNAMERYMLTWADQPKELTESGHYKLKPVQENEAYWSPTRTENEYYLYEYRSDKGWDAYLPSKGILIYHVDQSTNVVHNGRTGEMKWNSHDINNFATHQCFDLIEAVTEAKVNNENQIPFPGASNVTRFDAATTPANLDWAGNSTHYNLSNISSDGSFDLSIMTGMIISGTVSSSATHQRVYGATATANTLSLSSSCTSNTDQDGYYSLITKQELSLLEIQYTNHARYVCWIDGENENVTKNVVLQANNIGTNLSLSKAKGTAARIAAAAEKAYVGVEYTGEELEIYNDCSLAGIEFSLVPDIDRPETIGVFLFDKTTQTMLIEEAIDGDTGNFENSIYIGQFKEYIILDSSHDYIFGYFLDGNTNDYPILTDNEEQVAGGAMISTNGSNWSAIDAGNILARMYLNAPEQISLFPTIFVEKRLFNTGDVLQLRLRRCQTKPETVTWTFDGKAYETGDLITLTNGEHILKAVLTFADGSIQTLVQEIGVL